MSATNDRAIEQWADDFLGMLVSPKETVRRIASQSGQGWSGLAGGLSTLILVSAVSGSISAGTNKTWMVALFALAGIFCGLVGWLSLAGAVALAAASFNVERSRIRAAIIATAWGFLPLLFVAPIAAYRAAFGAAVIPLLFLPAIWVVSLEWLAVQESYQLKGWQTLLLLVLLPQLAVFLCLFWSCQILGTTLSWLLA